MEERIHHDVYIKKMHDNTMEELSKQFFKYVSDKIKRKPWGIKDQNIMIRFYRIIWEKRLWYYKKNVKLIAKFTIAMLPEHVSFIVVYEEGKGYYEKIKKIGEKVGYDRIYKKWESNGKNHVELDKKEDQ